MAARLEQDAKPRATKKPAPIAESGLARLVQEIEEEFSVFQRTDEEFSVSVETAFVAMFKQELLAMEARGEALWDKAVESLGRSADVLEELAESTGEAIARIAARGDRIDRIQKETRALLNALVASEADA